MFKNRYRSALARTKISKIVILYQFKTANQKFITFSPIESNLVYKAYQKIRTLHVFSVS